MPIEDKYNELVTTLKRYNDAYYNTDTPLVTDAEYDMLYKQLVSIENEYPQLLRNDSPTQYVGSKIAQNTGFKKAKHKRKMLSLANVFSTDELKKWLEELNALPSGPYAFIAEPKYDGLSIELVYKHGKLVDAVTRGDGWIGESVIQNVLTITNIPKVCNMPKHCVAMEVYGEIVMPKEALLRVNSELAKETDKLYTNCRNAASGALRQKDPLVTAKRGLVFYPYDIYVTDDSNTAVTECKGHDISTGIGKLAYLRECGFNILLPTDYVCESIPDVIEHCLEIGKMRDGLSCDIDGVVIKTNTSDGISVPSSSKYPKNAVALKFPPTASVTELIDVLWSVGRTGVITPVGIIRPVELGGVTVSKVTLHNAQYLVESGLGIKDEVTVIRSGDVIPKIIGNTRTDNHIDIILPTNCPSCGDKIYRDGVSLWCTNTENCPDAIQASLAYSVSRPCLDIPRCGPSIIKKLYDELGVKTLYDLLSLPYRDGVLKTLTELDGVGETMAKTLIDSISKVKHISAERLLASFGINNIGREVANKLVARYKEKVFCLTEDDFDTANIPGIGEAVALSYINWIGGSNVGKILAIVEPVYENTRHTTSTALSGYVVCITGTFDIPRASLVEIITSNGGRVSENTNIATHLLVGDKPGSKASKWPSHKPIISYDALLSKIGHVK